MVNRRVMALVSTAAMILSACATGAPPTASTQPVAVATSASATQPGCVVGVSWGDRQGRWAAWDEPAMQKALAAAGATYLSSDAMASAATQASDVESLISQGARVLLIEAQNGTAIVPSVMSATAHGIPVLAYDRLIEDPGSLYISFDNAEVGRMQARALLAAVPKGNYVFIKGDKGDANSDFLRAGQEEVLSDAIRSGDVKNVGETYTANWNPGVAQAAMEEFLVANDNKVDAVLSENDGMAGGAIAALAVHGLAGVTAVSGQDGDSDALNAVARGTQTVDVWKDARLLGKAGGEAAVQLCAGVAVGEVSGAAAFKTPAGNTVSSILLDPVPVTRDSLSVVLEAGWTTKDMLCHGVTAGAVAACP